jgi:hypothetical protein
MSSEEMRIELETFVNAGLREGWHGWPLKGANHQDQVFGGRWHGPVARMERASGQHSILGGGPDGGFGALRLFDWERKKIRAGARFISQQSRS